ncbi:MAG: cobalamin biosynthesis protein, partial [Nitrosopumilales archaeon]|nr:cobalamin biosynthesis protein [Nitrosopumilales archaeon]
TVTKVSAYMVNEEKVGVYQDVGEKNWWNKELPANVTIYSTLEDLKKSSSKGYLLITDRMIQESSIIQDAVIYRPSTLVVGVGLHWDTSKETIKEGLDFCLRKYNLSGKSIAKFVTLKKEQDVQGLIGLGKEMKVSIEYFEKEELSKMTIPNPSETVLSFEGTPSVSEAAAIKGSGGKLLVEKQKFPPNLTIAIARIPY